MGLEVEFHAFDLILVVDLVREFSSPGGLGYL